MTYKATTAEEAKALIKAEFMERYHEWLKDYVELSDYDYGKKYGWGKGNPVVDNQKAVIRFTKYMFSACRDWRRWEELGYRREAIWQLHHEGFLSEKSFKWETYYYISQNTAKQIYAESKTTRREERA